MEIVEGYIICLAKPPLMLLELLIPKLHQQMKVLFFILALIWASHIILLIVNFFKYWELREA